MAMNLFDLTGKVALVTGGNSGLGLGYARGLAKAGADLMLWARDDAKSKKVAEELRKYGGRVETMVVDVVSEEEVVKGFEKSLAIYPRIDAVFANAGRSSTATPFQNLTTETFNLVMLPNLYGAFYTLREASKHMVQRAEAGKPGGSIVITGSLSSFGGMAGMQNYAGSKHAVTGIMKSMAVEFGKYGVRVNLLAPGVIQTGQIAKPDPQQVERINAFAQKTPIPRLGVPEDFEGISVYLTSDLSSFHSGDIIVIDGAWSARVV